MEILLQLLYTTQTYNGMIHASLCHMTAVQQLLTARGNFLSSMGMFLIQTFSSAVPVTNI